jgi:hypothetical protein
MFRELSPSLPRASLSSFLKKLADIDELEIIEQGRGRKATIYTKTREKREGRQSESQQEFKS